MKKENKSMPQATGPNPQARTLQQLTSLAINSSLVIHEELVPGRSLSPRPKSSDAEIRYRKWYNTCIKSHVSSCILKASLECL